MTDQEMFTRRAVSLLQKKLNDQTKRTAEEEARETRATMQNAIAMLDMALQRAGNEVS